MYLQITRCEITQSSCKRDTKSKSHVGMNLAPVRVFSCRHPPSQWLGRRPSGIWYGMGSSPISCISRILPLYYDDYLTFLTFLIVCKSGIKQYISLGSTARLVNMYCDLCQTRKLRREFPANAITDKCQHAPLHCFRVSTCCNSNYN